MRSGHDQLLEAELMNSTPEHVYAWLKRRAEPSDGEWYGGDEELEAALLTRESDLINLALARYGSSGTVVRKLFTAVRPNTDVGVPILGRSDNAQSDRTQVLRIAALSNCVLARHNERRFPTILFADGPLWGHPELTREFITSASSDEVITLFQNPTIGDYLARLYDKEPPFDELSEERWQELIEASVDNPRLQAEYSGKSWDGWGQYMYGRVSENAWALAGKVPTTKRWADILRELLGGLVEETEITPVCTSIKDTMAVIQRWRCSVSSSPDTGNWPSEDSLSECGYLGDFATMRLVLARLLFDSEIRGLKTHEDIAMRCAFYHYGDLKPEELKEAHAREPKFLLNHAFGNDAVWRQPGTRYALRRLCYGEKLGSDGEWYPSRYESIREQVKLKHPDWFSEYPDWLEDEIDEPEEHSSSSQAVVNLVKTIDAQDAEMRLQIASLRTRLTAVLWIVSILLVFLLLRGW